MILYMKGIKNQDFIFILIEGEDVQQKPHFNHS